MRQMPQVLCLQMLSEAPIAEMAVVFMALKKLVNPNILKGVPKCI